VAAEHVLQSRFSTGFDGLDLVLQQRLTESRHVAVPEDAEGAGEEFGALAVTFDVLVGEEPNSRLRHRESDGALRVGRLLGPLRCGANHGSGSCLVAAGGAGNWTKGESGI